MPSRRHFLLDGTLILATAAADAFWPSRGRRLLAAGLTLRQSSARPVVRFGILTDVHYADKPTTTGTRFYRDSLATPTDALASGNRGYVPTDDIVPTVSDPDLNMLTGTEAGDQSPTPMITPRNPRRTLEEEAQSQLRTALVIVVGLVGGMLLLAVLAWLFSR